MPISLTKFVDITSGIGGGAIATTRELVGRLFTGNTLLPPNTFLTFSTAQAVGEYFGTTSEEYLRAVFYFSWISKNNTRPQSIQYARWADVAAAPRIYSAKNNNPSLSDFNAITDGSFILSLGGVQETFTAMDFNAAGSLTAVAGIIEAEIQTGTGAQFTAATVTYNALTGSFDFVGGDAVEAEIIVTAGGGGTDITGLGLMGWIPEAVNDGSGNLLPTTGAIWSDGVDAEDIDTALENSFQVSNNFGSFLFLDDLSVTQDQVVDAATWNNSKNVQFLYTVGVSSANASAYSTALNSIGGVCLTLSDITDEYPEMAPMMIEAATDYTAVNAVQNYMFQQFPGLTASVTDTSTSDSLDNISVNYYGATQTAGQQISFYQRGVMQGAGVVTNILDINSYVNEIWLKDAAGVALLNLLLGLAQVPANQQGRSQVLAVLQDVVNQALNNGTISVDKLLNSTQKAFITAETNDPNAWYQVQNSGYWLDAVVAEIPASDPTQYQIEYTLIYSKDDVIRKVVGIHTLI